MRSAISVSMVTGLSDYVQIVKLSNLTTLVRLSKIQHSQSLRGEGRGGGDCFKVGLMRIRSIKVSNVKVEMVETAGE